MLLLSCRREPPVDKTLGQFHPRLPFAQLIFWYQRPLYVSHIRITCPARSGPMAFTTIAVLRVNMSDT